LKIARVAQNLDPLAIAEEIRPAFELLATRVNGKEFVPLSERLQTVVAVEAG
jgi:hypothetical protein